MTITRAEPLWLAVAGKGGSGKSTVSGILTRALARLGRDVVAFDSDTMPGMCRSLGVVPEPEATRLMEAIEPVDDRRWRLRKGFGPVRTIQRCTIAAPDGVRLLQLGKVDSDTDVVAFTGGGSPSTRSSASWATARPPGAGPSSATCPPDRATSRRGSPPTLAGRSSWWSRRASPSWPRVAARDSRASTWAGPPGTW